MRRRALGLALGLVAYLALGLAIAPFAPSGAIAQVAPPCGTPAWTASPGAPVNAQNINSELLHLESCAASAGGAAPNITPSAPISATVVGTSTVLGLVITGTCLVIVGGALEYSTTACPTAGPQATPSPTLSDAALLQSGSWPYTIGFNPAQPDAQTWGNIFNVNYNTATGCMGAVTGAPIAESCVDGTSTIGFDVGPVGGSYSSGTANSQELCFHAPCCWHGGQWLYRRIERRQSVSQSWWRQCQYGQREFLRWERDDHDDGGALGRLGQRSRRQ